MRKYHFIMSVIIIVDKMLIEIQERADINIAYPFNLCKKIVIYYSRKYDYSVSFKTINSLKNLFETKMKRLKRIRRLMHISWFLRIVRSYTCSCNSSLGFHSCKNRRFRNSVENHSLWNFNSDSWKLLATMAAVL